MTEKLTRRGFLKKLAAGAAGIALANVPMRSARGKEWASEVRDKYPLGSEKREAALFLVEEAKRRVAQIFAFNTPEDAQHQVEPRELLDYGSDASRMQDNIDYAFQARVDFPWTGDLSHHDFFHYVLPYRVGNMSLEQLPQTGVHWRQALMTEEGWNKLREHYGVKTTWKNHQAKMEAFAQGYRKSKNQLDKQETVGKVVRYLNTDLWSQAERLGYKRSNAQEKIMGEVLMDKGGRCADMTHFITYVLRAYGLPATTMRIPAWAKQDDNHQLIGVKQGKKWMVFDALRGPPAKGEPYERDIGKEAAPKIYVEEFGNWSDASRHVHENRYQHPWHVRFYQGMQSVVDATHQLTGGRTVDIAVEGLEPNQTAYVHVLNNFNAPSGLAAVAVEKADDKGRAVFRQMGHNSGIVYFTANHAFLAHDNGKLEKLDGSGEIRNYTLEGLDSNATHELHHWRRGQFTGMMKITPKKGQPVEVRLEPDRVCAHRITPSAKGAVPYWSRPFVPRKSGQIEPY